MAKKKKVEEQPQVVVVRTTPTWTEKVRERNTVKK